MTTGAIYSLSDVCDCDIGRNLKPKIFFDDLEWIVSYPTVFLLIELHTKRWQLVDWSNQLCHQFFTVGTNDTFRWKKRILFCISEYPFAQGKESFLFFSGAFFPTEKNSKCFIYWVNTSTQIILEDFLQKYSHFWNSNIDNVMYL